MPCTCWYDPPERSKKFIKGHCEAIVDEVKRLRKDGDPCGCEIEDVHKLIHHLYYGNCNEIPKD